MRSVEEEMSQLILENGNLKHKIEELENEHFQR